MARKKPAENEPQKNKPEIFQIRVYDLEAAAEFRMYAAKHKMKSYGPLLVKSFRALQAQEAAEQKK